MNSDSESDDELLRVPTFKKSRTMNKEECDQFDFLNKSIEKEEERRLRDQRIAEKRKQDENLLLKEASIPTPISNHSTNDALSNDREETASVVSKSPSAEGLKLGNMRKISKYDDNDPSYWSRIDDIEKNAEDNRLQRDKRQREMHEYIHGYNSDEGYDSSSDRKNNIALMDAMIAGASSTLGTRLVMFSEARIGARLPAFPSLHYKINEMDAHQSLHNLLQELEKFITPSADDIWTRSHKIFIQNYKRHLQYGLLVYYLEGHRRCMKSAQLLIPDKLMSWLVTISCSCDHRQLQSSALSAAISCLENNIQIVRWPEESTRIMNTSDNEVGQSIFHLTDFLPFFQAAFGLWSGTKSPSRFIIMSRSLGLHMDEANKSSRVSAAMKLWSLAFEKDIVFFEPAYSTNNEDEFEPVVSCIASIVRLGIDPFFHSGMRLEESRVNLFNSFFLWLSRKASSFSDKRSIDHIIQDAAGYVLDASIGLSDSLYNNKIDHGDEDPEGWLPISLILRSYQSPLSHKSSLLIKFYAHFAIVAIRKSFYEKSEWDVDVVDVASKIMGTSKLANISEVPIPFLCLAFTYVGMGSILNTPTVANDGPRYHCLVELSALCSQIGIALLKRRFVSTESDHPTKVYEDYEEADRLNHEFFEPMENVCEIQKKKITSVISSPHLRRCKELLVILGSFYRALKDDASLFPRKDGSCKKQKVQTALDGHLMRKE